jgi:hypothetical protein
MQIYTYKILHGDVKQCILKQCKNFDFYLRGDFIFFLMISQLNGSLQILKLSKYTSTTNSYDFAKRYGH